MASKQPEAAPASDQIPRLDNAVSVGEDLDFQRKWWRFEKAAWVLLSIILVADALGAFGRGWLANATVETPDGTVRLRYERIERADTPSVMTMTFRGGAVQNERVHVFCSESLVKDLGAQRIIPQPVASEIGPDGITYTFLTSGPPSDVGIALQPNKPGIHHMTVRVPGSQPLSVRIVVLP